MSITSTFNALLMLLRADVEAVVVAREAFRDLVSFEPEVGELVGVGAVHALGTLVDLGAHRPLRFGRQLTPERAVHLPDRADRVAHELLVGHVVEHRIGVGVAEVEDAVAHLLHEHRPVLGDVLVVVRHR